MPMLTMLIICVVVYFTLMVTILLFHKMMNPKITNLVFIIINILLFVAYYLNDFNRNDGKFTSLTFDQISPFTFTTLPLSYLFSKKIKDAQFSAVAFLSLGMFVAMLISPQHAFLVSYRSDATLLFVLDTLLHLNCSLFGIYLIVSGQVLLNARSLIRAFIYMYSVIAFVLFMNFAFHQNYFGMGPYSDYGIYMFDLFNSYWMTLIVYLLGVGVVLSLGFEFNYILQILNNYEETKIENREMNIEETTANENSYDQEDIQSDEVKMDVTKEEPITTDNTEENAEKIA